MRPSLVIYSVVSNNINLTELVIYSAVFPCSGKKNKLLICAWLSSAFTYLTKKVTWSIWDTSEVLSSNIEKYVQCTVAR